MQTSDTESLITRLSLIGKNIKIIVWCWRRRRYDVILSLGYGNYKESQWGLSYSEDEFYGIRRTDLLGGIRFYF